MSNYLIQLIRNNSNSKKRRKTSPFRVIRKIYQFFYDRPIKAGIVLNERYQGFKGNRDGQLWHCLSLQRFKNKGKYSGQTTSTK